jgi:hypothetical protein
MYSSRRKSSCSSKPPLLAILAFFAYGALI